MELKPNETVLPETIHTATIPVSPTPTLPATLASFPSPTPTLTLTPILSPTPACTSPAPGLEGADLKLFGNFHTMGVSVDLPDAIEGDPEMAVMVEYRTGDQPFRLGFPLSKVGLHRFVGSLFWLEPGNRYDVKVSLVSPGQPYHCNTLEGSAATRSEVVVPEPTRVYIVSPDGRGTACSLEAPCMLREGIRRVGPGEAVFLRQGVYHEGELKVAQSGMEGKPILIQSYPGEQAILDGSDPGEFSWEGVGNGVFRTKVRNPDLYFVGYKGKRLYPYHSIQDLEALKWNLPGFYIDASDLYVKLVDGSDPNDQEMIVSSQKNAFSLDRDFIYIVNLAFRYYSQGSRWRQGAIFLQSSSDNLIQGNSFYLNLVGVAAEDNSHRNLIQDNEFYDAVFEFPWDAVYDNTKLVTNAGIRFHSEDRLTIPRGNVIRRNTFHDLFDGFGVGVGLETDELHGEVTNEVDVYENTIYRTTDDGMEADRFCSNVRIWNNVFHDVFIGVSMAPAFVGPVYVIRNTIYNTGAPPYLPFGEKGPCCGSGFKFINQAAKSRTGPIFLFHNTVVGGIQSYGLIVAEPANLSQLVSRNNIWVGDNRVALSIRTKQLIDFDFDALWSGNYHSIGEWPEKGNRYSTLGDFSFATGLENHGINANPFFIDLQQGNYRLSPDSLLIDAGLFIPGINDTYTGLAPDIGAFEAE